jgi:hypothetical protein
MTMAARVPPFLPGDCPHEGVPLEALLPYPELAFRKTGARAAARAEQV